MTEEKFRLWLLILLASALMTVWLKMGLKTYKYATGGYGKTWQKRCVMMDKSAMKHHKMMKHGK